MKEKLPCNTRFLILLFFTVFFAIASVCSAEPGEKDVFAAMKKASRFMMDEVSMKGGFVWKYSADLTERWGEVPARKTQIWVQPPGTVSIGELFLNAYRITGDTEYLDDAKRVANALVRGQHPSGGWHYFIDFDMTGVQKWYDEVASKCWGWAEYYHFYGNCTFDDDVVVSAIQFLMDLYMTTLDSAYREPLLKALDFVLESQYPNGAWPQRYPIKDDYPSNGHPDYTPYYTFNDNVIRENILILLDAWHELGNEEYKKAAYRGMDFYLITQMPPPQAGWSEQYDLNLQPAAARSYEPKCIWSTQTTDCINEMELWYKITGNKKYLRGIPEALDWLEKSIINTDPSKNYTHARFYEIGTNKPLYVHREGTSIENGRYWVDYEPVNFPGHYGMYMNFDVDAYRKEFERLNSLTPEEAMAEYTWRRRRTGVPNAGPDEAEKTLRAMDKRGAWVTEITIPAYKDIVHNPPRKLQGIDTRVFIKNMSILLGYLRRIKK